MKNLFKLCLTVLLAALPVAAQTGGQFAITQSVVGSGASSSEGNFGITGTIAQPNAGDNSTGGNFAVKGGFWQASLAPTTAQVSVSGKAISARGNGIRNIRVSITNQAGETRTVVTGELGHFLFTEIAAGETYILTVHGKRFRFSNGTIVLFVVEDVGDIVFIADWQPDFYFNSP